MEKISPDLVADDAQHQVSSVRGEAVNAVLLLESRQQHARVEQQSKIIAEQRRCLGRQQKVVAALMARLDALEKVVAKR